MKKSQRNRGYEHDDHPNEPSISTSSKQLNKQLADRNAANEENVTRNPSSQSLEVYEVEERSNSLVMKAQSLDDQDKRSNHQRRAHSPDDRELKDSRQTSEQTLAHSPEYHEQKGLRQQRGQSFEDRERRDSRQQLSEQPLEDRKQTSHRQQRRSIHDYEPRILRQQVNEPAFLRQHNEHSREDQKVNNAYDDTQTVVNIPMQFNPQMAPEQVQPYFITPGLPPGYVMGYPYTSGDSAALYGQTQEKYYPVQVPGQYGPPVPYLLPAPQYIARDAITPMPNDFEEAGPIEKPPIAIIIFKRIFSAIFILLDVILSWWAFSPDSLADAVEDVKGIAEQIKGKAGKISLECSGDGDAILAAKTFFTAVSTIWAVFQIINMTGETLLEYHKQRKEERTDVENADHRVNVDQAANVDQTEVHAESNELDKIVNKFKSFYQGFQVIHGWVETVVSMTCGDIPQVIVNVFLGAKCSLGLKSLGKTIPWMIFKAVKNDVRKETCKQKYKPCCGECCKDCGKGCCEYVWDIPCICTVCIFRLCPTGKEQCCESKQYKICPEGICSRGDICFGEIKDDPEWAYRFAKKLDELYFYLCVAAIGCTILKNFKVI